MSRIAILFLALLLLVPSANADWVSGDGYKMHFPQFPDESGWDVNATWPVILADDWLCSDTGWIKDIHFWGSWRNGDVGQITSFKLSIHEDLPKGHAENPYCVYGHGKSGCPIRGSRRIDPTALSRCLCPEYVHLCQLYRRAPVSGSGGWPRRISFGYS